MPPHAPRTHRASVPTRALTALLAALLVAGAAASTAAAGGQRRGVVHARTARGPATARSAGPADTDRARAREYRVKAALLYNFLRYATFPDGAFEDAKAPVELLVVGKDPFGDVLEQVLGRKKIGKRPIRIRRVEAVPDELDAHLVFAGALKEAERKLLVKRSVGRHCLLIGETPGFAEAGASINFYKKGRKLAFEVNVERQKDTGVTLKAELLKLARIIEAKPPAGGPK